MPFEVGASRLSYPKACYGLCNYKQECPHTWVALSLDSSQKLKRGRPMVTNLQRKFYLTMCFL